MNIFTIHAYFIHTFSEFYYIREIPTSLPPWHTIVRTNILPKPPRLIIHNQSFQQQTFTYAYSRQNLAKSESRPLPQPKKPLSDILYATYTHTHTDTPIRSMNPRASIPRAPLRQRSSSSSRRWRNAADLNLNPRSEASLSYGCLVCGWVMDGEIREKLRVSLVTALFAQDEYGCVRER